MSLFSQRDSRWATERLGTVDGATIGQYGCYTTAQAMSATNYGIDTDPKRLDQLFSDNESAPYTKGGYVDGDLCWDGMLAKTYPDNFTYAGTDNPGIENPFDVSSLAPYDAYGKEAILELDFDHNPNDGIQTHFVRLYAYNGGNLIIDDPWYGTRDLFSKHYGSNPAQTILKAVFYDAHATSAPVVSTPPPAIVENVLEDTVPVQTTLSVTPTTAQTAEDEIAATPAVPEYESTYAPFPTGPTEMTSVAAAVVDDFSGVQPTKTFPSGTKFSFVGSFTYKGSLYYRGPSGSWYGVPAKAFTTPGLKVPVMSIATEAAGLLAKFTSFFAKSGVFKRVARFFGNNSST